MGLDSMSILNRGTSSDNFPDTQVDAYRGGPDLTWAPDHSQVRDYGLESLIVIDDAPPLAVTGDSLLLTSDECQVLPPSKLDADNEPGGGTRQQNLKSKTLRPCNRATQHAQPVCNGAGPPRC